MNVHHTTTQTTKRSEQYRPTETLLHGYRLVLARAVWITLVLLILVVFFMGIPQAFKIALSLHAETRAGLEQLGLSANFYAAHIVAVDTITLLAVALFAVLIFCRRPNDWMIMFVGLTLLLTAMLYTAPAFEAKVPLLLIAFLAALAEISQAAFVYLFPDGQFVPRWTWLILLPLFLWRPAMWGLIYLPNFYSLQRSGENFYYIPQETWDLALFLALLAVGIIAQVYRYRHHSTPVQRQQTKWLVLATAFAVIVIGSYVVAINSLEALQQLSSQAFVVRLLSRTINHFALLLLPVMLTFSILRYRLWEIDTLINRTLVYGTLTATLVSVYIGSIIILQAIFGELTGGNQLALVISTLVSIALFQPLRQRIQRIIDQRFYRRKYNAAQTLAAFSKTLRNEVDLEQLSEQLVLIVEETMQPTHVSLWLNTLESFEGKKTRRLPMIDE
jgi:hypothetical protein